MSLSAGAIVGIIIGAIFIALIIAYVIYVYWWVPHRNSRGAKTYGTVPDEELEEYIHTHQKAAKLMASYDDTDIPDIESEGEENTMGNDYEINLQQNDTQQYFDNMSE